jgi:hypothetical protein
MALDQIDVMLLVVAALEKLDITYCIGGSFASSIHGLSRSTNDIDLVAAFKPKHAKTFAAEIQDDFYADDLAISRAASERRSFNVIHFDTGFKVDVFVSKARAFDDNQIERRQRRIVRPGQETAAFVATPEDTVLAKLEWYRRGNEVSDQQWRDVIGVLDVQWGKLDLEYLRHWGAELGVSDLLEEALDEVRQKNT